MPPSHDVGDVTEMRQREKAEKGGWVRCITEIRDDEVNEGTTKERKRQRKRVYDAWVRVSPGDGGRQSKQRNRVVQGDTTEKKMCIAGAFASFFLSLRKCVCVVGSAWEQRRQVTGPLSLCVLRLFACDQLLWGREEHVCRGYPPQRCRLSLLLLVAQSTTPPEGDLALAH